MKHSLWVVLFVLLATTGCGAESPRSSEAASTVGSDRDEFGCIGSAGYQWCPRTAECERPWELAKKAGFENTPEEFKRYCGN
ncbi:MAG: hypothetical protein AAGA91_14965 [Pseudomonadota bacterium]